MKAQCETVRADGILTCSLLSAVLWTVLFLVLIAPLCTLFI